MANLNLELWSNEFAANLYETSDWYTVMKDWSSYSNGNIVHIPQAAAKSTPQAIDGTTSLPVATVAKTFQDITFSIKNIAAEPRHVSLDQDLANTFEGRTKLSEDMLNELKQAVSIEIAYGVQPAAGAISTSGTSTRSNIYGQASVKALTYDDILDARTELAKSKANLNMLYMVVDPVMYSDILRMAEFKVASELGDKVTVSGYVGEIAGIKVIQRNIGLAYTSLGAKPTIDLADGYDNTHFSSALVFDASKAGYAKTATRIGVEEFATGYYTDVMQARTRVGASAMYENGEGVVAIIESV